MRFSFFSLLQRLALAGLLGLAASAAVQAQPDANGAPDQFVLCLLYTSDAADE